MKIIIIPTKTRFSEDFEYLSSHGLWKDDEQILLRLGLDYEQIDYKTLINSDTSHRFTLFIHKNFIVLDDINFQFFKNEFHIGNKQVIRFKDEVGGDRLIFYEFLNSLDNMDTLDSFKLKLIFFCEKRGVKFDLEYV